MTSTAPAEDTAAPADDTAEPPVLPFLGIVSATWDGADGFSATWEAASSDERITYALIVSNLDGMDVARVDTEELAASVTGLADGEYWLRVEAASDEQTTDGGVRLNQLVHSNRLVYRSEVPIMGAMDVWGQDNT